MNTQSLLPGTVISDRECATSMLWSNDVDHDGRYSSTRLSLVLLPAERACCWACALDGISLRWSASG